MTPRPARTYACLKRCHQHRFTRLLAQAVALALLLTALTLHPAQAQQQDAEPPLDAQLHEHIVYVPVGSDPVLRLQVTVFRPDGPGPFPLAVLNHGKEAGDPRQAKRYRTAYAARYFVSRGYAVALPMLRGFAGSEGKTLVGGCDAESEGLAQARDIRQVIEYLASQADSQTPISPDRVVVSGLSLGGFNTLAVGALDIPGVRGLVNFAGGRNAPSCPSWQRDLAVAVGHYASSTRVPSLWFYGENDATFSVATWRAMFDTYSANGGRAELVNYGDFMENAHNFLGRIQALPVWTPRMDAFLASLGLPSQNLRPELLPAPYPAPSHFAELNDVAAVPWVNDRGRAEYQAFLKRPLPRVFAIASNGAVAVTDSGFDPLARALALCQARQLQCLPYAVDDQVVWPQR